MITRKDLSVIREKINQAVEEIASEYDAKMSIGNISYGGSSFIALSIGMGFVFALTRKRPGREERL